MNLRLAKWLAIGFVFTLGGNFAPAARGDARTMAEADAQILEEIKTHSEAAQNLENLADDIGPRRCE